MSKQTTQKKTVYDIVFDKIITQLEKGNIPWRKPWTSSKPRNGKSGRAYSGVNLLLLSWGNHSSDLWFTFKQVTEMGGKVKQGESATPIVFWQPIEKENEDGKKSKILILKYYNVFNLEQTEGIVISDEHAKNIEEIRKAEVLEAKQIVDNYADMPPLTHEGDKACYHPKLDIIKMPLKERFTKINEYYSTLFHEMAHSTGHEKRLNRKGVADFDAFGTEQYSEEELIAEFSSAFLCAHAGIDNTIENSAMYIKGWMQAIKSNPKILVNCASKAEKSVKYILNTA
jgi:antirestriction protein ArdC